MCQTSVGKKYSLSRDVYERYWDSYEKGVDRDLELEGKHYRAVNSCMYCRTESQGRIVYRCESCGNPHEMYKSCKHRFCEQCGVVETYRWGASLRSKLLNINHCHITFTLPHELRILAKMNGNAVYNMMFAAIVGVLSWWFEGKYGVKCGVVMVLHTSGSDLKYHPHIHCIVSCGGIKTDIESGEKTLFAVEGDYLVSHSYGNL